MIDEILEEATGKMESTLSVFGEELSKMRSGRASTALVDRMKVEYYGQDTELRQLASISTPEAMLILIRPYDKSIGQKRRKGHSKVGYRRQSQRRRREYSPEYASIDARAPPGIGEVPEPAHGRNTRGHPQYSPFRKQ